MTGRVDRKIDVRRSVHLDGMLSIHSAFGDLPDNMHVAEPISDGLKLVISNVAMDLRACGADPLRVSGPTAFVVLSEGEHERDQLAYATRNFWDVALTLDRRLIEQEFGTPPEELLYRKRYSPLLIRETGVDPAMRAMVTQLLTMPPASTGGMQRMGVALNLAATVLNKFAGLHETPKSGMRAIDQDRIRHAQELLFRDLAKVPDISGLARILGTNRNKLARDFSAVTGMTPHAWLQEQRLTEAWKLLANRACSVSEAAHAVGYGPAHFSTLFRRRFGASPRSLQGR